MSTPYIKLVFLFGNMVTKVEIVVIGGKYKGACGITVGETKEMLYVQLFGHSEKKCIRKSNVQQALVNGESGTQMTELSATVADLALQIGELTKELNAFKQDFDSMKQDIEGIQSFIAEYRRKAETIRNMINQEKNANM
jgi:predicted RNase H-like nuclease (RuvC/YqgF family)